MEIKVDALKEIITTLNLGTAKNKHVPSFNMVHFSGDVVVAQNSNFLLEVFPEESTDINCYVKASSLKQIVDKLTSETATFTMEEGGLRIESDKNTTLLKFAKAFKPYKTITNPFVYNTAPKNFKDAVEVVISSASNDLTQPVLTGVNCRNGVVCASNRARITAVKVPELDYLKDGEITIPSDACKAIVKLGNPTSMGISEDKTLVKFEYRDGAFPINLVSKLIIGTYIVPNPNQFTIENKLRVNLPDEIVEAVTRVAITTSEDVPYLFLESKGNGELALASSEENIGRSNETLEIEDGNTFKICINPKILLDILQYCRSMFVESGDVPIIFKNEEYISIVAPIIGD